MKKQDKNKTLIGLIMKSETSGAIYYWRRGTKYAEVIAQVPVPEIKNDFGKAYDYERPIGAKAPFDENSGGICIDTKTNKIIISPSYLPWTVLKEIHN